MVRRMHSPSAASGTSDRLPPPVDLGRQEALTRFRDDALGLVRWLADQGDGVRVQLGRHTVVLFSHPDYVQGVFVGDRDRFVKGDVLEGARRLLGQGLLTSEGELHRRQRRLIQPILHRRRLERYAAVMVEHATRLREGWLEDDVIDVQPAMVQLTMSVLSDSVLGASVRSEEAEATATVLAAALEAFGRLASPFWRLLESVPSPESRAFDELVATFDASVERLVRGARESGATGDDLLSRLVAAQDGEGGMSDRQVRDEVLTIMVAGHETWSNSLTWTLYLLAANPTARERLEDEVDRVLGGRPATAADVPALRRCDAVFNEALRLYPPAWIIGRNATADVPIGPFEVPAGSVVLVSPFVVHRDSRWFPDPEAFRPERWWSGPAAQHPFAYFPFGGGSRVCAGEGLARLAAVLLLATTTQRWRLETVSDTPPVPVPPLLRPAGGMWLRVQARQTAPVRRD